MLFFNLTSLSLLVHLVTAKREGSTKHLEFSAVTYLVKPRLAAVVPQGPAAYSMMSYVLSDGDKQVFPEMDGAAQATRSLYIFLVLLVCFPCVYYMYRNL